MARTTGSVLNERQAECRNTERRLLTSLAEAMTSFGASPADISTLRQALVDVDEMFLLVVVGEFNAGQSAFINAFLERLRAWGKKIVIVLNKVDLLGSPDEVHTVLAFIQQNAQALLGFSPELFAVSGRQAMEAKRGDAAMRSAALESSGFDRLES